jgi:hypothetical protein
MQRFAGVAAVIMTALLGSPALADTLVGETTSLPNANPATVEAWLEKLLGGTQLSLVYDYQAPKGSDYTSKTFDNLGFDWDYAVVKYAKNYAAYSDSPNDNKLSTGSLSTKNSISNVRFYRVPEPTALLLVGAGLVAAAPFVWFAAPSSLVSRSGTARSRD